MTDSTGNAIRRREPEQKCMHKGCILTMGYYVGGGQFICWLHALRLPGCMEAVKGQEMVALIGDSRRA